MTAVPRASETGRSLTRILLTGGLIAGPVFVTVFLIEGATRAGYNPVRLPVSLLSVGDDGWMQVVNFVLDGLLVLGFAIGLLQGHAGARHAHDTGTPAPGRLLARRHRRRAVQHRPWSRFPAWCDPANRADYAQHRA